MRLVALVFLIPCPFSQKGRAEGGGKGAGVGVGKRVGVRAGNWLLNPIGNQRVKYHVRDVRVNVVNKDN